MYTVYDHASFHGNVDFNLKQMLQSVAENLSYSDMNLMANHSNPDIRATLMEQGRIAYCTGELHKDEFAYSNGIKWIFIGENSINYNSLYKPNPAKVIATTNIALTGLQTIDGIALVDGDIVIVSGQTTKEHNGLYIAHPDVWVRATDADTWDELVSAMVVVEQGTINKDTQWMCIADRGGVLGTSPVEWLKIPLMNDIEAGAGLTRTDNVIDVNHDILHNTTFINLSDQIEVKRSTTGAIGIEPNLALGGIKVNVDGETVKINSSNQLEAIGSLKTLKGTLSQVGTGSGIYEGMIQSEIGILITHNFGKKPLSIEFHKSNIVDGLHPAGTLLEEVVYPIIYAVGDNDFSVKFLINRIEDSTGTVIHEIPANEVYVSVIG